MEDHQAGKKLPRERAAGRSQRKVGSDATLPWGAYAATAVADDMPATPPLFAAALVVFL